MADEEIAPKLTPDVIASVKAEIDSGYRDLDIEKTIGYFHRFFVATSPIPSDQLEGVTIADVGCGYGWLSLAFALNTKAKIIAFDMEENRIAVAQRLAEIFGVSDQITFKVGSATDLPLKNREAEITYCIEVLEHVFGNRSAFDELRRVTNNYIVASTPNRWFPLIAHDTRLPFCHWLPIALRDVYAKAFNRTDLQHSNLFWAEPDFKRGFHDFSRQPGFMQFRDINHYVEQYPTYLPYNGGGMRALGTGKKFYSKMAAAILGKYPAALLPNLSGVWRRSDNRA